jgi:hypothetical protein
LKRRALIGALAVLLAAVAFSVTRDNTRVIEADSKRFRVDLVASVDAINVDTNWSQSGGRTSGGSIRLSLDDLRVITVPPETMVDDYDAVTACSDFVTPNACVFLADMLGDAVVWFALVQADTVSGREFLRLPGLVDMQSNGDEGILRNGWILKLATPVKRQCENTDTSSLRDFINRFPDTSSESVLNLITDNVVSVKCL